MPQQLVQAYLCRVPGMRHPFEPIEAEWLPNTSFTHKVVLNSECPRCGLLIATLINSRGRRKTWYKYGTGIQPKEGDYVPSPDDYLRMRNERIRELTQKRRSTRKAERKLRAA